LVLFELIKIDEHSIKSVANMFAQGIR